ncbi:MULTISPECIES: hypothetical protein [unclassified Mucilaginibacter]|jgi:hypothetical protein|uniref:hypothetical protein n=1 Tax=unclassified Mucilaginibacter TaxID=2617802 RepID=UPI0008ABC9AD|nr:MULTISPECIES: hypothetical protein [unclassified Mucilaginibacter]WDF76420.1 hypothetical protein PQ469_21250 [Mucilaginibacter sp. KACC 22773]SEP45036.1 hypothetical protein SAMN05428947_12145 [Mucilaginibacter sp. OK283]
MESKSTFWQKIGLQDWFLPNGKAAAVAAVANKTLTPDDVYLYIIEKFKESVAQLSFADRVVFYHEYIISFNEEDYQEFINNRSGLFGIIVHESVKKFYELLREHQEVGKKVEPSSSKWVFRLVSHPDYKKGDKGFIGKLLPGSNKKEENLRVTFIPRHTGVAQTLDISNDILKGFTYYSEGYYELPYANDLHYNEKDVVKPGQTVLARLDTIMPDKQFVGRKVEFLMKNEDIVVSGNEETREDAAVFKIPSDWVNTPHLRIRMNKADGKLYLSSFGELTMINEQEITRSDVNSPQWVELPFNSKILLNGIIGINIFKPEA